MLAGRLNRTGATQSSARVERMETPLNAREFLKRFHLPQLVRISSLDGPEDEIQGCSPLTGKDFKHKHSPASPASHSNTSISSSFVALSSSQPASRPAHEPSDWTYSQASRPAELDGRGSENDEEDAASLRFRSISAWSSVQVDRMLELERGQRLQYGAVRVPRASLVQAPTCQSAICCSDEQQPSGQRKSVEFKGERRQQVVADDLKQETEKNSLSKDNIRLMPPSKRPALSKLHLNQPFLLYKAYRKLELCAYLIDPKNELNEKSGDPIYFPQNYPGECCFKGSSVVGQSINQ